MGYEVDYIPVGNGEKSGDAIAIRFGNLSGSRDEQVVIVVDGGFKESGQKLVEHIRIFYRTDKVDIAISTHPDADHASGLYEVLDNLNVQLLLMHKPWEHAEEIKNLFKDGRITASGLEDRLEKSLQNASDLEALATKKGIQIIEPFQGVNGYQGGIHILGPSKEYYEQLLPLFKACPAPAKGLGFLAPLPRLVKEGIKWIEDNFGIDLLDNDEEETSPENNTSTVILFNIDGHKLLFTGDAGKTGLSLAVDYAESQGNTLTDLAFLDVPHHGSKHNISSKLLKRIKAATAFISASQDSPKHPSKKVTNGLKKHGTKVYVNRGNSISHRHNAPERGWSAAIEEPFHNRVEE